MYRTGCEVTLLICAHDRVVVLVVLVVDEDHAFAGDQHADVAALAFDREQMVLDLDSGKLRHTGLSRRQPRKR